ncbi:Topoisomerase I damage affected protein [Actinidia chinensis var. chinensis]|uniref:Topoisomerase I damage affected protein n=1 Tax=Actinidia chinensis var. chinensis TaxID=1590841 RepID=A0A2R6RY60_ACTCC|nr:Topoisomerase I damage affected protein [Actinidia chinensis var. chinensis]
MMTVTSLALEIAFVLVISPTSAFSKACETAGAVRVPIDVPEEVLCFPAHLFQRSKVDLLVSPIFLAVIVAGSAYVVRLLGILEVDDDAQ